MTAGAAESSALLAAELPPQPYPGLRPFEVHEWSIFFGRERMVDDVVDMLGRQPLVVVHGSSGAGKSSLIRAGVLPRLARQHRRHQMPWRTCAIRPSGGPLWNLATELAHLESDHPQPERVDAIRARFDRRNARLGDAVAELAIPAGERVCILIDQFEEIFRYARETSLGEAELLAELLTSLLDEGAGRARVSVILTMRSEFLGECARLSGLAEVINRAQYLLPRMDHASVLRAIRRPAEIYGGEVTETLAERLIAEVRGSQDELPLIQHGLRLLWPAAAAGRRSAGVSDPPAEGPPLGPRLDLEHYDTAKGLAQLLSGHADAVMANVLSNGEEVKPWTVEHVFRALIDINADGQAIRRPRTLAQLVDVTGSEAATREVIEAFRAEGVSFITPYSPDPIAENTDIDISHEALIRCWQRIADPKTGWLQTEFQDGLDWRALSVRAAEGSPLAPAAIDERERWLAQRTPAWSARYGGQWDKVQRLLANSRAARDRTVRLRRALGVVALAVFAVVAGLGIFALVQWRTASERAVAAEAKNRWYPLLADRRTSEWREGLWRLTRSEPDVRRAFVAELLANPSLAGGFLANPEAIWRALVGLSDARRQSIASDLKAARPTGTPDPGISRARALLAVEIRSENAANEVLEVMKGTTDPAALSALGQALAGLGDQLPAEQASAGAGRVLDAMKGTTDPAALRALGQALAELGGQLPAEQASAGTDRVLEAMKGTTNPAALSVLGQALVGLCSQLPPKQASGLAGRVLEAMKRTTNPAELSALGQALAGLGGQLPADQASGWAGRVLEAMERTTNPFELGALGQALAGLGAKLPSDRASAGAGRILEAMRRTTNPFALSALGQALAGLGGRLPAEQTSAGAGRVLEAMKRTTNPFELGALGKALAGLGGKLPADQASAEAGQVLEAMKGTTNPFELRALGQALAGLAGHLPAQQASAGAGRVLEAMKGTADPTALSALGQALAGLGAQLPADQASGLAGQVVEAMKGTTNPFELSALGQALAGLGGQLPAEQASAGAGRVLEAMKGTTKASELLALGEALAGLGGKLPADQAAAGAGRVLEAMRGTTVPDPLRALGQALGVLASRLESDRAFAVLVFETLKYPWVPVGPLGGAMRQRFRDAPESAGTGAGFWPLVDWAHTRFKGVVDFEAPPVDPGAVMAAVERAASATP